MRTTSCKCVLSRCACPTPTHPLFSSALLASEQQGNAKACYSRKITTETHLQMSSLNRGEHTSFRTQIFEVIQHLRPDWFGKICERNQSCILSSSSAAKLPSRKGAPETTGHIADESWGGILRNVAERRGGPNNAKRIAMNVLNRLRVAVPIPLFGL